MKKVRAERNGEILREYDFSKGVRGKYAERYEAGSNVVLLSPDVAKAFPSSESVNEALRALVKIARNKILKTLNRARVRDLVARRGGIGRTRCILLRDLAF